MKNTTILYIDDIEVNMKNLSHQRQGIYYKIIQLGVKLFKYMGVVYTAEQNVFNEPEKILQFNSYDDGIKETYAETIIFINRILVKIKRNLPLTESEIRTLETLHSESDENYIG